MPKHRSANAGGRLQGRYEPLPGPIALEEWERAKTRERQFSRIAIAVVALAAFAEPGFARCRVTDTHYWEPDKMPASYPNLNRRAMPGREARCETSAALATPFQGVPPMRLPEVW
ncbi:MAG: hypothetical protein ACT4QC_15520 [Planctomycetaceae bacterium]